MPFFFLNFHYDELLLRSHHHAATFPPSSLFHCSHFLMNVHDPWRLFRTAAHLLVCLCSSVSLSLTPTQCVFISLFVLRGRCLWLLSVWMLGEMQEKLRWFLECIDECSPTSQVFFLLLLLLFVFFFFSNSYHSLIFMKYNIINYILSVCGWMSQQTVWERWFYYYCHCMGKDSMTIQWAIIVWRYFVHY